MTDKEILISKAIDKKKYTFDNSVITYTNFLSVDEKADVVAIERQFNSDVETYYYGGFDNSERTVAVFVPKFYDTDSISDYFESNEDENPLCAVKLVKDRFSKLTHRDYLGSLMGLGIKREMLGDIIITEDGCYVICLKSISKYICENLKKSGRGTVSCEVCSLKDISLPEECFDEIFLSLASLRLDNIVSGGFNLSRGLSAEAIIKGVVFVNSRIAEKPDTPVKQGDKVVLRGKGKIILSEIIGENKKGRIHIKIKKFG